MVKAFFENAVALGNHVQAAASAVWRLLYYFLALFTFNNKDREHPLCQQTKSFNMRIASLILLFVTTSSIRAQSPRFEIGLQAGPSLAWLSGNTVINNWNAKPAYAGGFTLQYDLTPRIGLRIGLGYQQKGTMVDALFTDAEGFPIRTVKIHQNMEYLTIPLMARASFGKKHRIVMGLGGYAGYLMNARYVYKNVPEFSDTQLTSNFLDLDYGLCASVAGAFALSEHLYLNTEVRYDKGLRNISALTVVNDGSIRTNAVSLLVGCSYRFGKTA